MSVDSSRSANSDSKSKRRVSCSGNSWSSNKKSKSNNQKTLGVAWGSNSRSSFPPSPFSDFASYMEVKNRKLHDQFDAEASTSSHDCSSSGKPLFYGVAIFVDGYTVPSSQELKGYMLKHGGRFENYFSRRRVTHIICSNLPDSKIKNLRSFSGGLPVVKPMWVLDSVAANKLLSWIPYQLDQLASAACGQPKLSAFFTLKSSPVSNDAATFVTDRLISETTCPLLKGDTTVEEGGSNEHEKQYSEEADDLVIENSTGANPVELSGSNRSDCEKMSEPSNVAALDGRLVETDPESSPCCPSASVSSYCVDNTKTKESSSSALVGPSNQSHSTLVDPNFVENYFKNSRLHFIGTWRNRYRKRFPSLSNGFKCTNSNLNASALLQKTAIIHVDMDCFFVSVVIRNHPELRDKPVAVCHSDNPRGTAEISSANYPARDHGVRAGIFVRDAKALCPHLVIFPYDFQAYEEVADQLYDILHKHCNKVQAVSCDEAFIDVTNSEVDDPQLLASIIRKDIYDSTGCTASAGIAGNMLMARLATRTAKPNGQCYIHPEKVDDYLHELPIKALPGIGHVLEEKLKRRHIKTCGQLRMISKESLQKDFGFKTGDMLWNYSRGIDNRLVGVIQESKSIGAEVNWGVRFNDLKDSQHFLVNLCKEVALRLQGCAVQGRTFTLKVKKRRSDAEEPIKYMGCGDCENLSHSITVPMATDDVDVLQRIASQLFGYFHIDVKDIRGMGLQVSKLESADNANQGHERNSIRSWLNTASASNREQCTISSLEKGSANRDFDKLGNGCKPRQLCTESTARPNLSNSEALVNQDSALPPLCDLDMEVIKSLPPDLFKEINDIYGGELVSLISMNKGKSVGNGSLCTMSDESCEGVTNEGERPLLTHLSPLRKIATDKRGNQFTAEEVQVASNLINSDSVPERVDLMPSSLSQVDASVLQQLPEELRVDILELLPAHRMAEGESDAALGTHMSYPRELFCVKRNENQAGFGDSVSSDDLWVGNPPRWVEKFKLSNYRILYAFAEMYYRSGSTGHLSSVLLRTVSETQFPLGESTDASNDAISCFCELLRQYIKLKIETDIEEIYGSFCLLRRLTTKSNFFLQIYNVILPDLQASVGENYGGNLNFHF